MPRVMQTVEAQFKGIQRGTIFLSTAKDLSCDYYFFRKNIASFYPCPKNLPEAKLKSNGLIYLVVEISREPNIESVMWLSVITFNKSSMKNSKWGGKKYKTYSSERKRTLASLIL